MRMVNRGPARAALLTRRGASRAGPHLLRQVLRRVVHAPRRLTCHAQHAAAAAAVIALGAALLARPLAARLVRAGRLVGAARRHLSVAAAPRPGRLAGLPAAAISLVASSSASAHWASRTMLRPSKARTGHDWPTAGPHPQQKLHPEPHPRM